MRRNSSNAIKKLLKEDDNWTTVGDAKLRNGDYVVTPAFKGVYHVRNSIFFLFFCVIIKNECLSNSGGL